MTVDHDLSRQLDLALDQLPAVPATDYLVAGRRARRHRRALAGTLAAATLVAGGVAWTVVAGPGSESDLVADEAGVETVPAHADPGDLGPDPDYVAPEPANAVEAVDGLEGVDSFSTRDIPSWAQEYGNHGPVAIAPDGRLWVAPDAVVRRTVVSPLRASDGEDAPITSSYAVEAEYDGAQELGGVVWVILYTDGTGPAVGQMDEPGRWTDDFELWVDDVTADIQGRPSFAERLVRFADDGSQTLVPGAGVEMVRQLGDVQLGSQWPVRPRSSVAEVRWSGKTWFVQAQGGRSRGAWYAAYDPADSAPDLDGFVEWLRSGS